jgi:hypothetical protein
MRLSGDEVDDGLVVAEGKLLPADLLPDVLLLQEKADRSRQKLKKQTKSSSRSC